MDSAGGNGLDVEGSSVTSSEGRKESRHLGIPKVMLCLCNSPNIK